ncbi:MAG: sugar ABC transporter substrate-binding protein, partial [bacterium]|nr:sugar ABC transporter substrate-binding protein [bacterium]
PSLQSVLDADPTFAPGGDRHLYVLNLQGAPDIAVPRPATPAYGAIRDAFSDALADIVAGADVQSTLDEAVQEIDDDIEANEGYPTS